MNAIEKLMETLRRDREKGNGILFKMKSIGIFGLKYGQKVDYEDLWEKLESIAKEVTCPEWCKNEDQAVQILMKKAIEKNLFKSEVYK